MCEKDPSCILRIYLYVTFVCPATQECDYDESSLQKSELSAGMVAGAVCAVVFLLLACVGFVIWRSYCKYRYVSSYPTTKK